MVHKPDLACQAFLKHPAQLWDPKDCWHCMESPKAQCVFGHMEGLWQCYGPFCTIHCAVVALAMTITGAPACPDMTYLSSQVIVHLCLWLLDYSGGDTLQVGTFAQA